MAKPKTKTVLYLASEGAEPEPAVVLDAPATLSGYEPLNLQIGTGKDATVHPLVAAEVTGPNAAEPRWRPDNS